MSVDLSQHIIKDTLTVAWAVDVDRRLSEFEDGTMATSSIELETSQKPTKAIARDALEWASEVNERLGDDEKNLEHPSMSKIQLETVDIKTISASDPTYIQKNIWESLNLVERARLVNVRDYISWESGTVTVDGASARLPRGFTAISVGQRTLVYAATKGAASNQQQSRFVVGVTRNAQEMLSFVTGRLRRVSDMVYTGRRPANASPALYYYTKFNAWYAVPDSSEKDPVLLLTSF